MTKRQSETRWTPVRRGKLYCSTACGGKCLFTAFQHATEMAKKIRKRLGTGWTVEVWENLGWHWKVRSPAGRITVGQHPDGEFVAYVSRESGGDGGNWMGVAMSPRAAVFKALTEVQRQANVLLEIIEDETGRIL